WWLTCIRCLNISSAIWRSKRGRRTDYPQDHGRAAVAGGGVLRAGLRRDWLGMLAILAARPAAAPRLPLARANEWSPLRREHRRGTALCDLSPEVAPQPVCR